MDFGRSHVISECVASRSGIRYIPEEEGLRLLCRQQGQQQKQGNSSNDENTANTTTDADAKVDDDEEEDRKLDRMTLKAANDAAIAMLVPKYASSKTIRPLPKPSSSSSSSSSSSLVTTASTTNSSIPDWIVDASLYKHRCLPSQATIQVGDLVVIMISFDTLNFVYAKRNAIFSNRNGHFHHNDFLGQPFGCKVRSRNNQGYGFCYLLKPTPELWIRSLPHRTQIVQDLDQSQIVFQLQLKPNCVVVESGTGSGAMSHAILRTIAPHGHLHTYEFNPHRAKTARDEFERHGLSHLVTVRNVDVCAAAAHDNTNNNTTTAQHDGEDHLDASQSAKKVGGLVGAGFVGVPAHSVDAVFLDLPEPWNAIPHAALVLKPNGRIANYSPCIEQTQRAVQALEKAGFHSIQTMEYRLMQYYVDKVTLSPPPTNLRRPCLIDANYNPAAAAATAQPASKKAGKKNKQKNKRSIDSCSSSKSAEPLPKKGKVSEQTHQQQQDTEDESKSKVDRTFSSSRRNDLYDDENDILDESTTNNNNTNATHEQQKDSGNNNVQKKGGIRQGKTMIVARPFGTIRGHTAFLTF
ncbi:hypothetical protein ACA910_001215 [Epithemia clementina (nom. ined.)]